MKTIYTLFDSFSNAQEAIGDLLEEDFDEEQMNVIVRERLAEEALDVDRHVMDIRKSDEVGEHTARGLMHLLGGQQPVHLPDIGEVLAGGELATMLAKKASSSWAPDQALTDALEEFGIPDDVAEAYQKGINDGGLLFWIRVEDERAGAAANALRAQDGQYVADYGG